MESTSPNTMKLTIITPDTACYTADIEFLLARALDGYIGFYPKHIPTVAALDIAPIKVVEKGKERLIAVFDGFLEVTGDSITIISDHCEFPDMINVDRAKKAHKRALKRLQQPDETIDVPRAKAALHRAIMRLKVAGLMDYYAKDMEE